MKLNIFKFWSDNPNYLGLWETGLGFFSFYYFMKYYRLIMNINLENRQINDK